METATFHDFESFAASLQQVDVRMMLTYDRGQRWRTQRASLGRITINYGLEGGGIICEGAARADCVGLFVPMKNAAAITCNGSVCDDNCWLLQLPGREFRYNVTGSNEWVTVFIPLDVWSLLAVDLRRLPANRLIQTSPPLIAKYREVVWRYLAIDHRHSRFLEIPSIQNAIEDELLSLIASMVSLEQRKSTVSSGRPAIPRDQVMRRAMNWLDGRTNYRIGTSTLAAVAGVSERTLRSIFREFYGVGPLRYLKLRQLHSMRDALKHANPKQDSVTEVAVQLGIWELGRFAHDYRQLFGESPAQTLRGICA
jgi:AraC family transcriptional regulator, ethanolamine operon transcriptional activator